MTSMIWLLIRDTRTVCHPCLRYEFSSRSTVGGQPQRLMTNWKPMSAKAFNFLSWKVTLDQCAGLKNFLPKSHILGVQCIERVEQSCKSRMRTNFIHMIFWGDHPSHLMIMISQIASKGDSHIHIVFLQVRSTCNNFDTDQSNTKMTDANPDPSKKMYYLFKA